MNKSFQSPEPPFYILYQYRSVFTTNEKCMMELNSFLDIANVHCNEENVPKVPQKQLPKPSQVYNIKFYLQEDYSNDNLTLLQHKIYLPDPLVKTDITR